jgi:hypothetical protein
VSEFSNAYEAWLVARTPEEKSRLRRFLATKLRAVWSTGDAEAKKLSIDFVLHASRENVDLVISALRDTDITIAREALGTIALLVWEGHIFDVQHLRQELEAFARLHPDDAVVCRSVLRRLA